MNSQPQKPVLKRYPKEMLLSHAKLLARDPDTIDRLMALDEGAYIVTKP